METLVTKKVSIVLLPIFEVMEIQERIALKAHDLFLKYGIRSISMDEIASQLGISKKTIYQFYADKDALVGNVIDMTLKDNENECFTTRKESENPVHEIFIAMNMVQELLKVMNPIIVYDLQKYHPAAHKKLADHQNKFLYRLIKENLEEGIALQLYRPEINIEMIARFRLATVFMMFNPDFFPTGKYNLATVMEETTILFLYGITTAKGQKLIQKYQQQLQNNHHI
ncbi:MAG: TetR/AcrR family transcriptional regulator [Chitinophagaceae bacterium]|nr:TetR/AcrR family transcriptional regulator [Chitinophagaceae bacterium]